MVRLLILLIMSNVFCNRRIANQLRRHAESARAIAETKNECARDMMHELTSRTHNRNSEIGVLQKKTHF